MEQQLWTLHREGSMRQALAREGLTVHKRFLGKNIGALC